MQESPSESGTQRSTSTPRRGAKSRVRAAERGQKVRRRPRALGSLPASSNIKLGLLILSVLIVLGTLLYSHQLVDELKSREFRVARLFADAVNYYQSLKEPGDDSLYHLIVRYTGSSGVPIILTDPHDQPDVQSFERSNMNVPYDSTLDSAQQLAYLREQMRDMDRTYRPIPFTFFNEATKRYEVTNYIHYGDSNVLSKIEALPFIQMLLGTVVVFIGYLSFSYLKRSEQSNIWVGMAKETAHQLGTPLSSLLGWAEILRLSADQPDEVQKVANEIERDIERLNRIAVRFSKIGSIPDLKPQNVVTVVSDVMAYFEGRMPHLRKSIKLSLDAEEDEILVPLNRELFEWVMENLIKNAFEAIEEQTGLIRVHIHKNLRRDTVMIDVTDTGKGFDMRRRKDVFRPGFSTKARGWGLGLSLSKRIVQEYHHGKLFVKESVPGQGTTFRIRLKLLTA